MEYFSLKLSFQVYVSLFPHVRSRGKFHQLKSIKSSPFSYSIALLCALIVSFDVINPTHLPGVS